MLPGEYKQVHLYEDGLVALAEQRLAEGSFVGQRLCGWRGDGDRTKVPMPLLQVVERRPHTEEGHTLVLKSVGRVRETAALEDDAAVAAWADRRGRESEGAWREAVCDPRASHLHDECVRQQRRLDALESRGVPPVPAPAPDLRYEWGHESYLPVFEAPIDALLDQRRDALLRRGMDEAPLSSLDELYPGLHDLWAAARETDVLLSAGAACGAEAQLLSFTLSSSLPRRLRMRALLCRDTVARIRLAERALEAQLGRLAARAAIEEAIGEGGPCCG